MKLVGFINTIKKWGAVELISDDTISHDDYRLFNLIHIQKNEEIKWYLENGNPLEESPVFSFDDKADIGYFFTNFLPSYMSVDLTGFKGCGELIRTIEVPEVEPEKNKEFIDDFKKLAEEVRQKLLKL